MQTHMDLALAAKDKTLHLRFDPLLLLLLVVVEKKGRGLLHGRVVVPVLVQFLLLVMVLLKM